VVEKGGTYGPGGWSFRQKPESPRKHEKFETLIGKKKKEKTEPPGEGERVQKRGKRKKERDPRFPAIARKGQVNSESKMS